MSAELVLAPEVELDTAAAYSWYERCRPGLGEEFLSCVEARLELICRTPGIHATVHRNYRRALVRRFPYVILYEYQAPQIVVYGIFHASQDSQVWQSRLP